MPTYIHTYTYKDINLYAYTTGGFVYGYVLLPEGTILTKKKEQKL